MLPPPCSKHVQSSPSCLPHLSATPSLPSHGPYAVPFPHPTHPPLPQTEARRQLFDSYAEHAMRAAGVPVWDITAYGMGGLYRHDDLQHFDGQTTRTLNLEMAEALLC